MPADPQHELESLRSEVRKLTDALELAKGELALALDEIKRKERVIAGLQQRLYGASSEKLDPNQLQFQLDELTLGKPAPAAAPDDPEATRAGRSPEFYLVNAGPITFNLLGGQSPLAAPNVAPSAIPQLAISGGGFAGVALRDVLANTYVLSKRKNGNDAGNWQALQFTAAELAPFSNNGRKYTLDYLDYNKGSWGWTYMDTVSIPGDTQAPDGSEAEITSIKIGYDSASQTSGTQITVWVPYGTDLSALTPTIEISWGASLSPLSEVPQDFTNPVQYTVTSSNTFVTNLYTVTVVATGSLDVKTYDETSGADYLAPISNLQAVTPTATATQAADIYYGNGGFVGSLPGLTNNGSFSVLWEGWFDVSKDGPGNYTFGTQSDDGSMIYLDLNNDGDFDDPGELVVQNNGNHNYDSKTGTVNLPMDAVRIAIGYYNGYGDSGMDARFKRGASVGFGDLQRIGGKSGHFRSLLASPFPTTNSSAALWYLNAEGAIAEAMNDQGTNLRLIVPPGTDLRSVKPSFNIAAGASCDVPSGTSRDFSSGPQTYTVTAADSTPKTYTVTVIEGLRYEFADGTMQGWHNRVWDLSVNGSAGGWIDLDPNVTNMPGSVNSGAIQPPSGDNGLFLGSGRDIFFSGHNDNHLNTLWLRSPEFILGNGDLTMQIGGGVAHNANPTQEGEVPFNPANNLGWKGAILRRASDGTYLLVKPKTDGNSANKLTLIFTQAELTPFVGTACTLELINADRGSWGFLTMDNVVIPTQLAQAQSPYDSWLDRYSLVGPDSLPGADADKDGKKNLLEFAFDTDPKSGASSKIAYSQGSVTPGDPKLDSSSGYAAVFGRLLPPNNLGLTYTVQFSADLDYWESSNAGLTVLAADSEMEAVSVPFPATIRPGNPVAPKFFRVLVTQD